MMTDPGAREEPDKRTDAGECGRPITEHRDPGDLDRLRDHEPDWFRELIRERDR